jgi:hypothetical protein
MTGFDGMDSLAGHYQIEEQQVAEETRSHL